jgi:hypothetical protein
MKNEAARIMEELLLINDKTTIVEEISLGYLRS